MQIEDNDIKNRNPFTVPDEYFAKVHNRVMSRLPQEREKRKNKVTSLLNVGHWGYAAATILMFTIGGVLFYNDNIQMAQEITAADEYNNEYIDELLENYHIDEYALYSYLTSADTGY